jgi:phage tail-like protein
MGSDAQVSGVHHFKLDLGGLESGMLFSAATMPSGSLDVPDFKTVDNNGNPVNSCGGGTQVTWAPIQLTRGVDSDHQLWDWFKDVREKGACEDTKKEVKIIAMDSKGETLHTWNLTGAVITNYGMAGADAQTAAILTEMVTIKYEDATLEA